MASPFFDNPANAVTAAPGTGSFVLGAAVSGARSILTTTNSDSVFSYYALEGANWEIGLGIWTQATSTLTRNVKLSSNSNAAVSFGAGVVVSLNISADEVQPHIGCYGFSLWQSTGGSTITAIGGPALTTTGTVATLTAVNAAGYRTSRKRTQFTSAATASALAGVNGVTTSHGVSVSTTSRLGGFEYISRFGIGSALPAGPRALFGVANAGTLGTVEPTALTNFAGFYRASTGGNLLFGCRGASGTAEGVDTGIALAQDGWYEAAVWANPGSQRINGSLVRLDTPQVFMRLDVGLTNPPAVNTLMFPVAQVGLSAASTAFVLDLGSLFLRSEMV